MPTYAAIHIQNPRWERDSIPYADQVYEPEQTPVDTGLVNVSGIPIFRLPEPRLPIGFHITKGTP
jgi:hypothetical protein